MTPFFVVRRRNGGGGKKGVKIDAKIFTAVFSLCVFRTKNPSHFDMEYYAAST